MADEARKPDPMASMLGASLVAYRWARTTKAERSEHGRQLVAERWRRYRERQAAEGVSPRKRRRRRRKARQNP